MNKEKIDEILSEHKLWLVGEGGSRADFINADLREVDLRGADLRKADLRRADLRGADLRGADLQDADLRYTDIREADLRYADMRWASLRGANLREADLRGADLDYSAWPLWCGSLNVKVDKKIAAQLAYHFCALDCDDLKFQQCRDMLLPFANRMRHGDVPELQPSNDGGAGNE